MRQIKIQSISEQIEIVGEEAKHLIYSLRSKSGERIAVVDENGERAIIELVNFTKDTVIGKLVEMLPARPQESITLAVGLIKRGIEEIIRQATEIGVKEIQPIITERTIARPSSSKQERWQRIAKEAAEQSGAFEPTIKPILKLNEYANQITNQIILCNESEDQTRISDIKLSDDVTIIIGSEGGFSENEVKMLKDVGAISVTLGKNILKVDTAAIMALSIVKISMNK